MKTNKFLQTWGKYVAGSELESLLALYDQKAILKPTLSKTIRDGLDEIRPYFEGDSNSSGFLNQGIVEVNFDQHLERNLGTATIAVGKYHFKKGNGDEVSADYTFTLERLDSGDLKIISHHSSLEYV